MRIASQVRSVVDIRDKGRETKGVSARTGRDSMLLERHSGEVSMLVNGSGVVG